MTDPRDDWQDLLSQIQQAPRDQALWQQISQRILSLAKRTLRGPARNDAEDIAQQVVVKILEGVQLDAARSPNAYIKTTIRNTASDLARRKILALRAVQRLAELQDQSQWYNEVIPPLAQSLLEELPPEDKHLLERRFLQGMSVGEIAQALHMNPSTVSVRIFRALKKLRERNANS